MQVTSADSVEDAIAEINRRPKPLALYIFAQDEKTQRVVAENTSSGGITINSCLLHVGHPGLPFGGIGNSGMGAYHGKRTFSVFSHDKPVLNKAVWSDFGLLSDPFFLYPPFTPLKEGIVNFLRHFL